MIQSNNRHQNLKHLSNDELDSRLKSLIKKENELLGEILLHIQEVDGRKLYLKKGCASLFEYLTKHHGYSNGPAQRRIDAARLLKEVPTLLEDLQTGDLNLSHISLIQKCIRQKELDLKKSSIEANKLSQIKPNKDFQFEKPSSPKVTTHEKIQILNELKKKSILESEKIVSQAFQIQIQTKPKFSGQADESVRLEITFTKEQWQKLERMKSLISHSLPDGSWNHVLDYVADKVIASKTKIRPKQTSSYSQNRKIILQKQTTCQHVDQGSQQKCNSTWKLQADHIRPRWAGGSDDLENLQVLCAVHNQLRYQNQAGIRRI